MAVTSGKDTGKTMGGGSSGGGSSGGGGGGPGGGSLSAPNRTAPSAGSGGQRGAGSNTGPGSARPGSDTASKAASSTSSSKSSTSKSTGPDRGPTLAPARTAPSAGLTSNRSASKQASVDKAKQSYSQYGGAQTSMRNATVGKTAPSAKVQDPSRGLTSPMSGQGSSFSKPSAAASYNRAAIDRSKPVAQDASIAGRAKQADKNYTTTSMGGNVSRTYSDPDVKPGSLGQSYTDSILGGLRNAASAVGNGIYNGVNSLSNALNGPMPSAADPSFAGRIAASNNLATRFGNAAAAAPGIIGGAISNAAGSFIDNLMGTNRPSPIGGSILGNQPTSPSISQSIAMDPISYNGPRAGTAPRDTTRPDQSLRDYADPLGTLAGATVNGPTIAQAVSGITQNRPAPTVPAGKQIVDRLPQIDDARQKRAQAIADARKPVAQDPSIAGRAKQAANAQVANSAPPASQPTVVDVPYGPRPGYGFPTFDPARPGQRAATDLALAGVRGLGDDVVAGPQPSSPAAPSNNPLDTAPSQQGNYPSPSQDDGQADDWGQVKNRASYEANKAIDNAKQMPGKILDALIAGDFRKYNGTTNDKRSDIKQRHMMAQQALQGLSSDQQAALITQLMVLLQQTSGNASQAALVNNTFV